ncbi:MAG: hypothetical protein IPH53_20500 [Flavobacteriales bacterium]|nr:hypothetical protein [Flavobacteriales bacterium]
MYYQGERVKQAKASGGGEFMVWNGPLEGLRVCSSSMVHKAKEELLSRGYLVELPGARIVNGRLFSGWMAPLVDPEEHASISRHEHTSISSDAPEHTSISRRAPLFPDSRTLPEHTSISSDAPEHTSISRRAESEKPRARTRGGARGQVQQQQQSEASSSSSNNDISSAKASSEGDGDGRPESPQTANIPEPGGRWQLAFDGLRWAKYSKPSAALAEYGADRCLAALECLCLALERGDRITKTGGFVFTWLSEHSGRPFAEVTDMGFAHWWDQGELPGNMRRFGR